MRGKPKGAVPFAAYERITPAGAGKTASGLHKAKGGQDHPRRCGENSSDNVKCSFDLGSPPQVRGKPVNSAFFRPTFRITPAGAGKTQHHDEHNTPNQDHPRRCGENFHVSTSILQPPGSPPQVRGKPAQAGFCGLCAGITPAGAGKTSQTPRRKDMK